MIQTTYDMIEIIIKLHKYRYHLKVFDCNLTKTLSLIRCFLIKNNVSRLIHYCILINVLGWKLRIKFLL